MTKNPSKNPVEATTKTARSVEGLPDHEGYSGIDISDLAARNPLRFGAKLRDENFFKYPMIPNGVFTYQQIVSSREWALGGEVDAVFEALDMLNSIQSKNLQTGVIEYGFEAFQKRRAVDYLTVGRTAFGIASRGGRDFIQYLDPTRLYLDRQGETKAKKGNYVFPVRPKEKAWVYDGRRYAAQDIVIQHPLPLGANLFLAPLASIIPGATLAWLVRAHNMASLDGRKIRDILMVGSPTVKDAINEALKRLASIYEGAKVSEVGVPVIEINNMSGVPIKDLFAMLGLSNVPESLDQKEYMEMFANNVSSLLGIALRHVWNDPTSGNRSVEETQLTREQEKGPSAYIRTEQRLINQSGFLNRDNEDNEVRFGFIEESDLLTLSVKAEVLKAYGEAALSFKAVFGVSLTLPSFMSWMKRIGAMPLDLELDEDAPAEEVAVDSGGELIGPDDTGVPGDSDVVAMEKSLRHGKIIIDRDGQIIGRRIKIFALPTIKSLVSDAVKAREKEAKEKMIAAFEKAEDYVDSDEEDKDIEMAVSHQIQLMAGEKLLLLKDVSEKDIGEDERLKLTELEYKINFHQILSLEEISMIDKLCDKLGITVFDYQEMVGVQ